MMPLARPPDKLPRPRFRQANTNPPPELVMCPACGKSYTHRLDRDSQDDSCRWCGQPDASDPG